MIQCCVGQLGERTLASRQGFILGRPGVAECYELFYYTVAVTWVGCTDAR